MSLVKISCYSVISPQLPGGAKIGKFPLQVGVSYLNSTIAGCISLDMCLGAFSGLCQLRSVPSSAGYIFQCSSYSKFDYIYSWHSFDCDKKKTDIGIRFT